MSRFITPYPQTLGRLASSSGRMIRMFAKLTGGKVFFLTFADSSLQLRHK
jgi:hypothetical protein